MPFLISKALERHPQARVQREEPCLSFLKEIIGYLGVRSLDLFLLLKISPFGPCRNGSSATCPWSESL